MTAIAESPLYDVAIERAAFQERLDLGMVYVTNTEELFVMALISEGGAFIATEDLGAKALGFRHAVCGLVRQHIHNLRPKVGASHIENVPGKGYRWLP